MIVLLNPFEFGTAATYDKSLLSGDEQSGTDYLSLSGDMQSGTDDEHLSGTP